MGYGGEWNDFPYQANLKNGTRLTSVLHPEKDEVYVLWQAADGDIKVTKHSDGELVSTNTFIEKQALNHTPLAAVKYYRGGRFFFHVFFVTRDYELASTYWTDTSISRQDVTIALNEYDQPIKVFGDTDLAAIAFDNGYKLRVWYQQAEDSGEGRHLIKQYQTQNGKSFHGEFDCSFVPLPGTRMAATYTGTEENPTIHFFAQNKYGSIMHCPSKPGAEAWAGDMGFITGNGVILGSPFTCAGFHNSTHSLVCLYYLGDKRELMEYRALYVGDQITRCHHKLPHLVDPTTDLTASYVRDLKTIDNIEMRLHLVAPMHALKSLTYLPDGDNGGWQDTAGPGYMDKYYGVIDIGGATFDSQQRAEVYPSQRPIPSITYKRVRCQITEDKYYCWE